MPDDVRRGQETAYLVSVAATGTHGSALKLNLVDKLLSSN